MRPPGRRSGPPLVLALVVLLGLLAGACEGASNWLTGAVPTPTPTPTPVPKQVPVPSIQAEPVFTSSGLYLREKTSDVTLLYGPWVEYQTIQTVKETLATTDRVLREELGIEELGPLTMYVTWEKRFNRFAGSNEFRHPAWLAGFASYSFQDGKAKDARVFVNAQAEGLVHNTAHELGHIAFPGMPLWIGEGVAEMVGTKVRERINPGDHDVRALKARQLLRQRAQSGELLDIYGLASFPWASSEDLRALEVAYAASWQFADFLARFKEPTLHAVIAGYQQNAPETVRYFGEAAGAEPAGLWSEFIEDIRNNLTDVEETGKAICSYAGLRHASDQVTSAWNDFLEQAGRRDPTRFKEDLASFEQQWGRLADETLGLEASETIPGVAGTFLAYFSTMQQAMELFSRGSAVAGNRSVAEANDLRSEAYHQLEAKLREHSAWLRCSFPGIRGDNGPS